MGDLSFDLCFADIIIWRYMDFWKFVSLLKEQALYFTRVDTLKDPFEGKLPQPNIERIINSLKKHSPQDIIEKVIEHYNNSRNNYYVNCWCMKDYESSLMWDAYVTNRTGIAVRSSANKLKNSFNKDNKEPIKLCKINYIDREITPIPDNRTHFQVAHKSKFYEDERELRVLKMKFVPAQQGEGLVYAGLAPPEEGLFVKVDLDSLIEEVLVRHDAPPKFEDLVMNVMKRYNLNKPVRRSDLAEKATS